MTVCSLSSLPFLNLGIAWAYHLAWGAHANLLPLRSDPLVFSFIFSGFFSLFFSFPFFLKAVKLGVPPKKCLFRVLSSTLEGFYEEEASGRA